MRRFFCFLLALLFLLVSCAAGEEPAFVSDSNETEDSGLITGPGTGAVKEDQDNRDFLTTVCVASGQVVWHVYRDELICEDAVTGEEAARIALNALLTAGDAGAALTAAGILADETTRPDQMTLIARDGQGITLCAALRNSAEETHTFLLELSLAGGQIAAGAVRDVTESFGRFYNPAENWQEVDVTGCADGGVFIAAIDPGFTFRMFGWNRNTDEMTELGESPFMDFFMAVPDGEDVIAVEFSKEDLQALNLEKKSMKTGDLTPFATFTLDSDPATALNYAWNREENLLCFTVENTAYRFSPGTDEKPVPFAVMEAAPIPNLAGVMAGDRYVVYGMNGRLNSLDIHAKLETTRLRVANTVEDDGVQTSASEYNASQSLYWVSVASNVDESTVLEAMLNQSSDYDIYLISTATDVFKALKNRGYYTDLGGSETLRAAVADMPEKVRASVTDGERLAAMPIASITECILVNTAAIGELTGKSREEIPTDWAGFLGLLNEIANDGILDGNADYTVCDIGVTSDDMKQVLLAWILRDCFLWMDQDENRINEVQTVLPPILHMLDQMNWAGLGLPEDYPDDVSWLSNEKKPTLISEIQPEIAVMAIPDGAEYWPLSLTAGGERLIGQNVAAIVVNPWSSNAAAAVNFAAYAWEHQDILSRMTLCQSMNEPVQNDTYNEEVVYLEQILPSIDAAIAAAETEEEANALRLEREEAAQFLENYRIHAQWLASEQSIAEYRELSRQIVPAVPEFWSADNEDAAILQYLGGMISAEQFVYQLVETLRMTQLEGY